MLKLDGYGIEATQKLKNAIIEKLATLGAFVDNELPNYILVMVANKKSKRQMAEDLELFLDDSSEPFTDWLHDYLHQLSSPPKESNANNKESHQEKPKSIIASASLNDEEDKQNDDFLTLKEEGDIDDPLMCELQGDSEESKPSENEETHSGSSQSTSRKIRISRSTIHTASSKSSSSKTTESHSSSHTSTSNVNKVKPIQIKRHPLPMSTIHRPPQTKAANKHAKNEESEGEESESESKNSLSSVIKINERKPRLSAPVQANSILLAKAVEEANKSVVTSPPKTLKPSQGTKKTARVSALSRLGKRLAPLPPKRRITMVKRQKLQEQTDVEGPKEPIAKITPPTSLQSRKALNSDSGCAQTSEEHKRLQGQFPSIINTNTKVTTVEVPSTSIQVANSHLTLSPPAGDIHIMLKRKASFPEEEKSSSVTSPHFVVTLDGVDPDFLITSKRTRLSSISSSVSKSNSLKLMDLEQNLDDFLDEEETLEDLELNTVSKEPKLKDEKSQTSPVKPSSTSSLTSSTPEIKERCRYWPACRLGDACCYHHPTSVCKNFPKCKFGDKCLFLHPSCKYDGVCSKPDCPFTHTKKPPAPLLSSASYTLTSSTFTPSRPGLAPQAKITCRFFPKCTNLNCPFLHPKPCKYGVNCMVKATCTFYHPPLPSFDQCRWVKPGSHSSGSLSSSLPSFSLT